MCPLALIPAACPSDPQAGAQPCCPTAWEGGVLPPPSPTTPSLARPAPGPAGSSPPDSPVLPLPAPFPRLIAKAHTPPFLPQTLLNLHGPLPSASFSTLTRCCYDNPSRAKLGLWAKHPLSTLRAFSYLTHNNTVMRVLLVPLIHEETDSERSSDLAVVTQLSNGTGPCSLISLLGVSLSNSDCELWGAGLCPDPTLMPRF